MSGVYVAFKQPIMFIPVYIPHQGLLNVGALLEYSPKTSPRFELWGNDATGYAGLAAATAGSVKKFAAATKTQAG